MCWPIHAVTAASTGQPACNAGTARSGGQRRGRPIKAPSPASSAKWKVLRFRPSCAVRVRPSRRVHRRAAAARISSLYHHPFVRPEQSGHPFVPTMPTAWPPRTAEVKGGRRPAPEPRAACAAGEHGEEPPFDRSEHGGTLPAWSGPEALNLDSCAVRRIPVRRRCAPPASYPQGLIGNYRKDYRYLNYRFVYQTSRGFGGVRLPNFPWNTYQTSRG